MFFEDENNAKVLTSFLVKSEHINVNDEVSASRLKVARKLIGYMSKSPQEWDARCTFNIKHIGSQFIEWLRDFDSKKSIDIENVYSMSYRFLCEFDFMVGAGREINIDLRSIKRQVENDVASMDENVKSQIIYASYVMPANIAKEFINDANIGVFKDFEDKKTEAEKLKAQWDAEIESKRAIASELKEKLDEYKIGFNFVGLYQGFSDMASRKEREASWLFFSLLAMGFLILAPLFVELYLAVNGLQSDKKLSIDYLYVVLPLLSIEIVLIYFFRIVLLNHRSAKAQIMQIELRKTLCQFIQSYADYSLVIKKQDPSALEKFENVIFSGVLLDPEKLPSTFDGLEHIGGLIKSIKNA